METFSALLALCVGNSPVADEFHAQRPVTRSFGDFFDLRLNKLLSKQSWGWWSETPPRSLWRQCNVPTMVKCSSPWGVIGALTFDHQRHCCSWNALWMPEARKWQSRWYSFAFCFCRCKHDLKIKNINDAADQVKEMQLSWERIAHYKMSILCINTK